MKKLMILGTLLYTASLYANSPNYIGAGFTVANGIYESDENETLFPLVRFEYNNFFVRGLKPGYTLFDDGFLKISAIADLLGGWKIDGSDMKDGLKNIKDRDHQVMAGFEVNYNLSSYSFANFEYLWGEEGSNGRLSYTRIYDITDRLTILPSIAISYYSEDYVNYYAGVSATEAKNNINIPRAYAPDSSFALGVSLTSDFILTDSFSLNAFAGYEVLDSELADSPLIDKDGYAYGGLGLKYSF